MSNFEGRSGTALLVIDLQNDVVASCFDVDGVLERTRALIAAARDAGAPVIYVQHEEPGMPRHSPGWELAAGLDPQQGDVHVYKAYRDSFAATDLARELDNLAVDRLVVAGAQTDYCVRTTAHRAAVEGYDVVLVSDCHTTEDGTFDGVDVTAAQIIAHTNANIGSLRYPGQTFSAVKQAAVDFSAR